MAVAPPTRLAVPVPVDGTSVPVLVLASEGLLLKFHCAMMSAADAPTAKSDKTTRLSRVRFIGDLVFASDFVIKIVFRPGSTGRIASL